MNFKVNFVSEFNLFMRFARNNNLSLRERMLWIGLFYIANDRAIYNDQTKDYEWPDDFMLVSHNELNLYCCLDKRGIEAVRNQLKQRGLIDFRPGVKNKSNPAYKINYLSPDVGYKNVPNDAPNHVPNYVPNDVPNHVPNHVPNTAPNPSPLPKYKPGNPVKRTTNQNNGFCSEEDTGGGLVDLDATQLPWEGIV
mgnify:CR=1 FL=1